MTSQTELLETARAVLLGNYRPQPIVLRSGRGRRVEDVSGKSYLDFAGGIAVSSVGHAHPTLVSAIAEQAARLIHVSNIYYNERAIELADALVARTGYPRVFFCNSGTEANEAQLKLARHYHFMRGETERVEIVATNNSFHGRTMGALSVTGQPKYHEGMGPLIGGVRFVDYDDLDAMRKAVGPKTAAVIVEPIQAEGGILVGSDAYLRGLRSICDEAGALLLFDEVQTGYGRTGRFLAREWTGVLPDSIGLAKGIGGGFPLGAMLVSAKVADALPPGTHGTTYGGNALACAAGLAVLRIFDDEGLVENAERTGAYLREKLEGIASRHASVTAVRGRGLLLGLVLAADVDAGATLVRAVESGVLATLAGGNVLRLTPPLNVTPEEVDEAVALLEAVLRDPPKKTP